MRGYSASVNKVYLHYNEVTPEFFLGMKSAHRQYEIKILLFLPHSILRAN